MIDLLLQNALIITMDDKHTIYPHGYLGITKDTITCMGSMETDPLPQAKKVLDLQGHPLLPGLIDGHGHAGHSLTKSIVEHFQGDDWENIVENIYYRFSDEDFWYIDGALAAAERIKFGITTGVSMIGNTPRIDSIWPLRAHFTGSISTGIRQYSGIGSANGPWPKYARTYTDSVHFSEKEVTPFMDYQTTKEALHTLNGVHPLQNCIVAPGRMGFRQWESIEDNIKHNRSMYELAVEYQVPIHTHAYGKDVQFLYDHTPEILDHDLSLTHSTRYSQRELQILSQSNATVFHGPTTHANINCLCPIIEMMDMGISVAIITDGNAPDRSFDLWRDMKNAQLLQRAAHHNSSLLPCGKVLEMVTREPAKALHIDSQIGSLETGKKADLISVNTDQPHLAPFGALPIQRLVSHAMGQDVDLVIVNGEIVMKDRILTKINEKALINDALSIFEKTMERASHPERIANPRLYDIRQA